MKKYIFLPMLVILLIFFFFGNQIIQKVSAQSIPNNELVEVLVTRASPPYSDGLGLNSQVANITATDSQGNHFQQSSFSGNGVYTFTNLPVGNYSVDIQPVTGWALTIASPHPYCMTVNANGLPSYPASGPNSCQQLPADHQYASFTFVSDIIAVIELNSDTQIQPTATPVTTQTPPQIIEYPISTSGSAPYDITSGSDGNLWFTEFNGNKIGKITTSGTVTNEYTIPTNTSNPTIITNGPDGNIWFSEHTGWKIGKVTTSGNISEFSVPTAASEPDGIVTGPDGNIWFAEHNANKIGKITTNGSFTEFSAGLTGFQEYEITPGPDGNLWFTEQNGNKIGRITTSGTITEFSVPTAASQPLGIIAGPDGNIWFTEYVGNKIGRITTSGAITEFSTGLTTGGQPEGITTGPDGNLWFTEFTGSRIGKITTNGTITEFTVPTAASGPEGITTGPDGNLWFTENNANKIGEFVLSTPTATPTLTPTTTPTSAPACGSSCAGSSCAGATGGCTVCDPGTNTCQTPPACGTACTGNSTCTGAGGGCNTCLSGVCSTPNTTKLAFTIFLDDIGKYGDNANPTNTSFSNQSPIHPTRTLNVTVYDSTNTPVGNPTGTITYNSSTGNFTGVIDMGSLATGDYIIKAQTNMYLQRLFSANQHIQTLTTNIVPTKNMISGNANDDNQLDIQDYNILRDCGYGALNPLPISNPTSIYHSPTCQSHQFKDNADLNDDGIIDGHDFNLFIRELSVQAGD